MRVVQAFVRRLSQNSTKVCGVHFLKDERKRNEKKRKEKKAKIEKKKKKTNT